MGGLGKRRRERFGVTLIGIRVVERFYGAGRVIVRKVV